MASNSDGPGGADFADSKTTPSFSAPVKIAPGNMVPGNFAPGKFRHAGPGNRNSQSWDGRGPSRLDPGAGEVGFQGDPENARHLLNEHPIYESLCRLYHARELALDCGQTVWDFAIEIGDLQQTGISSEQLRWLVAKQLIGHATEEPANGQPGRRFNSFGGFRLSSASCFSLTETGARMVAGALPDLVPPGSVSSGNLQSTPQVSPAPAQPGGNGNGHQNIACPVWDGMRRELRLGDVVVKKFKCRAANQEAILAAFEEDHWPARIDDPLPQVTDLNPKRRLADTIKCLNRKQHHSLVRFGGDGTGEGILWRAVDR